MTISLYVRKCDDSVQQYAGNSSILANLTGYESCFNGYYTNDKAWTNDIKDTDVYLHIQDLSAGSQVQSVKFNAYKKDWLQYQLRLLNLDTTHLYQFSIGIFPKDYPVDTNVYCAYIDKVELNAYQGAIPCSSFCEGAIYHKAIILNDNACSYEIEYPSLSCCSGSDCNKIENCQSYCGCDKGQSDYLTYHICSNSTGSNVWTSQSNSTYCDGYCKTQNIKEVPEILGDVCLGLESQGLGFLCGFFVPFFILTIIFIIIGAVLAWKTNAWQTFPITIIILFLVASMIWIEFAVIGIIICAVIAFMLAKMWNSGSSGK